MSQFSSNVVKPSYGQAVTGLFGSMFSPKTNPVSMIGQGILSGAKSLVNSFSPTTTTTSQTPAVSNIAKKDTTAKNSDTTKKSNTSSLLKNAIPTAQPAPLVDTLSSVPSWKPGQTTVDPKTGLTIGNTGGDTTAPFMNINEQNAQNDQSALAAFRTNGGVNPNGQTNATTYPGLVSALTASANQNPAIGQNAKDIASNYGQQIADVGQRGSMAQAGYKTTGTTPVAEGNAAIIGQTTAAQQSALAQGEQAALQGTGQQLTAQGQQQSGLLGAAGLVPEALRYGGTQRGSVMGDSIQNAVDMIKNGSTTQDAMSHIIGGDVGANAFISEMKKYDPNWNPTASNAIAVQNMTQGQSSQGQANDMSVAIKNLDNITALANDFLTKNDFLNPSTNKGINDAINTYVDTFAPSVKGNYEQTMGDITKFQSAILASNRGGIPTDVSDAMKSFDPHNLSAPGLKDYLKYLKLLGDNQLSVLQENARANYGSKGAYTGNQTDVNTTAPEQVAPKNLDAVKDPLSRAIFGGILNTIGSAENLVKGVAEHASLLLK